MVCSERKHLVLIRPFVPLSILSSNDYSTGMPSNQVGDEWTVEWMTPKSNSDEYLDNLVLSPEQAAEYGDDLVMALRVDDEILRERGLDPKEPFGWKIENGELLMKHISRQAFEWVAGSDREDSLYAQQVLDSRARRRIRNSQ